MRNPFRRRPAIQGIRLNIEPFDLAPGESRTFVLHSLLICHVHHLRKGGPSQGGPLRMQGCNCAEMGPYLHTAWADCTDPRLAVDTPT